MTTADPRPNLAATPELALTGESSGESELGPRGKRFEALHFAFRNTKLVIGLTVVLAFLLLAIIGPWLTDAGPFDFGYPTGEPPSTEFWLGTTAPGQDVYAQFVYGLRASFIVGALAACVAAGGGAKVNHALAFPKHPEALVDLQ